MPHKIFLSHNSNDKPLVEPVAVKLAGIFGQNQVFYDSWSIKPGDGIIDEMNKGLEAPEFVFFFVSKNSLASGMVKLEWQTALYKASNGRTRIVPVRIDESEMPAVLKQTLFIDMHTVGLDAAIAQIVNVTQGNASFTPQHLGFSNLSYEKRSASNGSVEITVKASHLMEPNPHFLLVVRNSEVDLTLEMVNGQPYIGGYHKNICEMNDGQTAHGISFRPMASPLVPRFPLRFRVTPRGMARVEFLELFHQRGEEEWVPVPVDTSGFGSVKIS